MLNQKLRISGIYYPREIESGESVYAWKSSKGKNEEINISDTKSILASDINGDLVQGISFRILMPNTMFDKVNNSVNDVALDKIIEEKSALTENVEIIEQQNNNIVGFVIEGIILTFLIFKTFSYIQESGTLFPRKKEKKIKYYKELPEDNITPGQAAFIKDINFVNLGNVFAASLLSLKSRGIIDFVYVGNEKLFENVFIKILQEKPELTVEQRPVYEFLLDYLRKFQKEEKLISLNVLQSYMMHSKNKVKSLKQKMDKEIKYSIQYYDDKANQNITKKIISASLYLILLIVELILHDGKFDFFTIYSWIYVLSIMNIMQCVRIAIKTNVFSEKGLEYRDQLKALERYLLEFSSFKQEGVPEITLWEYYIVYAEAFGISKKVLEQIGACYPNIHDTAFLETYEVCKYLEQCSFGKSFLLSISFD